MKIEFLKEYMDLIENYLHNDDSAEVFQKKYMAHFLKEPNELSEEIYEILNNLFCHLDCFSRSIELISKNPTFFVTESELKLLAEQALVGLKKIDSTP